jgi:hypothetical protein
VKNKFGGSSDDNNRAVLFHIFGRRVAVGSAVATLVRIYRSATR